jgi:hypothetical protein
MCLRFHHLNLRDNSHHQHLRGAVMPPTRTFQHQWKKSQSEVSKEKGRET